MADILGCSTPTIQAVELGKLKLSEKLAGLISHKTGINVAWLLTNDVTRPPIDGEGAAYARAMFEESQAYDSYGSGLSVALSYRAIIGRLEALILRAYTDDKMPLCAYNLTQAFDELEKKFAVTHEDHEAVNSMSSSSGGLPDAPEEGEELENSGEWTPFDRAMAIQERKKALRPKRPPFQLYQFGRDGQVIPKGNLFSGDIKE